MPAGQDRDPWLSRAPGSQMAPLQLVMIYISLKLCSNITQRKKKNHKKEKNPNPLLVLFINLSRSRQREERGLKAQLALVAAAR